MKELVFNQYKDSYRYNSDSLLLSNFILEENLKGDVLDIGCGCGIVGIILKSNFPNISLNLLDIQEKNITLCKLNLLKNEINANVFYSDFLKFDVDMKFDFLVSNPPFYRDGAQNSKSEHKNISKFEKFLPLDLFVKKVNSLIKPNGNFYFCYESLAFSRICLVLQKYKFYIDKACFVHSDLNKNARLVLIKAKKGSNAINKISPPIFTKNIINDINNKFKVKSVDIQ